MNKEKNEITVRPDLPLVEALQSKILNLTKSLPGFKHSKKMFGRQNSQYTSQLMSLTMLGDGPYHFMKQCSAQIDSKINALQGVYFKIKKSKHIKYITPWNGEKNEISFLHYGTGGTIFSKSFFDKTSKNLSLIKELNDEKPECFLQDLAITSLALISGCSVGKWEDLCIDEGSIDWLDNRDEILGKPTGKEALVHKHEFKE